MNVCARSIRILTVVLASCHGSCLHLEETRDVALGWTGDVSFLLQKCTPVAKHSTSVTPKGPAYEAVAFGTEDFACGDDVVHVHVAPAVRITVDFPATITVGEPQPLAVSGDDGRGRKLDLGDAYTETLAGVLEHAGCRCGDMDIGCALGCALAREALVAHAPGRGAVTISFGGLTATRDVVAIAGRDASAD